ncbi:hypothetical protein LEP1GSC079_5112 [Leptospira interrogans str. FPW1039]|uniref:Uncharacterized protein n=1 Tax=Leptospira interrogans str. FPW1039 TaxID=1193040 RepID=A0A0F6IGF0_LEPIR|nr:hypothetical protein LEP1GSC079_5112 [Leptospira interrogans str. FPW1039]
MGFVHKIVICGSSHILEIDLQSSDFFQKNFLCCRFLCKDDRRTTILCRNLKMPPRLKNVGTPAKI